MGLARCRMGQKEEEQSEIVETPRALRSLYSPLELERETAKDDMK